MLTLNHSFLFFFSKIGVCFIFLNRSLFFWKSKFGFFENRSLFFLKIGVCFLKIGVYFFENRGLIFGNQSLSLIFKNQSLFWKKSELFFENLSLFFSKSEYWLQILRCHSALEFEQNQWRIQGRGRGGPAPLYFSRPKWGPKKFFWDHPPPPPYLKVWTTAPLPFIWRSLFQFSLRNKRPGRFV